MVLVVLSWFAALLSKEMALTFPLIAVFMDWMLHRKLRWSRYCMMAGVLAVYAALRMHALSGFTMSALPLRLDPWPRLLSTITIFATYIRKMFVPHDISAFHVFSPTTSLFSRDAALAFAVLMIFSVGAWLLRRKGNAIFLIGFCVLTLLPVLNITLVGENVFADRYLYIPSLGACLLIPLASQEVWKLRPASLNLPGLQVGMGLLAALLGVYTLVLVQACLMWRDALTLYSETLKRSPTAMMMARNLGGYYHNQGDYDKAIYWYERAVELYDKGFIKHRPNLAVAYNCLLYTSDAADE